MCAEHSKPISGDNPLKYCPIQTPAPQTPTSSHLDPLMVEQIEINKKRQESLLSQLPLEEQNLVFSLSKQLDDLNNQLLKRRDSPIGSKEFIEQSNKTKEFIENIRTKFKGFDIIYIQTLISQIDINPTDCLFYIEISKSIFINKLLYFYEIEGFINDNKSLILQEFLPETYSNISVAATKFVISFKDIKEKELDDVPSFFTGAPAETHNFGKAAAFIFFYSKGEFLFKIVYKPRDGLIDKTVIDTFRHINRLPESQNSSEIPLPDYKIISMAQQSLWEYIDGEDIVKEFSVGAYVQNRFGKRPKHLSSAQKVLDRLDAVLTRMEISDLHKENVKIKHIKDVKGIIEIIPIDLENHQRNARTQLGGHPQQIDLTQAEKKLIDKEFTLRLQEISFRYLPLSTHVMAMLVQNYTKVQALRERLMKGFETDKIKVTMGPTDLEKNILMSMLNNDIPYFTEYRGKIYYGTVSNNQVIGIKE